MSHRKEIERKQQLQTQFQLSFSSINSTIDSWISKGPAGSASSSGSNATTTSSSGFESLPVIQQGQGLCFADDDGDDGESSASNHNNEVKISDFTRPMASSSGGCSETASKSGITRFNKNFKNNKRQDNDSEMLRALRNKLRDEKRTEANNRYSSGTSSKTTNGITKFKKMNGKNSASASRIQDQVQQLSKAANTEKHSHRLHPQNLKNAAGNSKASTSIERHAAAPNIGSESEDDDEILLRKSNSKKNSNNNKGKSKRPF